MSQPLRSRRSIHSAIALLRGTWRPRPLVTAITLALLTQGAEAGMAGWMQQAGHAGYSAAADGGRGGRAGAGSPVGTGLPRPAAREVDAALRQSIQNLGTSLSAIAQAQARQAAARNAALSAPSTIPDGLVTGGLQIDTTLPFEQAWKHAEAPVQTVQQDGRVTVDIRQTADQAILNWETFNVGRDTTVKFDQQPEWAVLNRVNDPSARPSRIAGRIEADGTVMILNRDGVVFTGSSQVNVRNLAVAAARMSDEQFQRGLYGVDASTATFIDAGGDINIEAGALIQTHEPQSVTQGGGYALLVGRNVHQDGTIDTRRGQTTLAAGDRFIIRKGVGTDGNTASTTRGNEVAALREADSPWGSVSNRGLIIAREGDITLTGHAVTQQGTAIATSTVNTRGTVHLLNAMSDSGGSVTLASGSTTAILLEDDSEAARLLGVTEKEAAASALDSQRDALIREGAELDLLRAQNRTGPFDHLSTLSDRRDQSRVEITSGGNVHLEGDSLTLATGGQIAVESQGRTFVSEGATLDVSGAVNVKVAMEANTVKVNVQGNELRDSPLNRDSGRLGSKDVWVDRRDLILVPAGTGGYETDRWYTAGGLLEVSGYLSNLGHSIGEWAAQGGTVTLSGSEVITQRGSRVNLSGGTLDVATGRVAQTWLRGMDGKVYRADQAPAMETYSGLYSGFQRTSARWGVTEDFSNPLVAPQSRIENGYVVGRDAGTLIISAPTAILEGDIDASVYNGAQQRRARDAVTDGYRQAQSAVAQRGGLVIGRHDRNHVSERLDALATAVQIRNGTAGTSEGVIALDADWLGDLALGRLAVAAKEAVRVEDALTLAAGGELELFSARVDVNADLSARGGRLVLGNVRSQRRAGTAQDMMEEVQPLPAGIQAEVRIAEGVRLDASGLRVDASREGSDLADLAWLDGGSVQLRSSGDIHVASGAVIDVSAGAAGLADQSLAGGRGGDVSLLAGDRTEAGRLFFEGELIAAGTKGGGTLRLYTADGLVLADEAHAVDDLQTLLAGDTVPVGMRLAEPLELGLGDVLPVDFSFSTDVLMPGEVAGANVTLRDVSAARPLVTQADWHLTPGTYGFDSSFTLRLGNQQYRVGDTIPAGTAITGVTQLQSVMRAGFQVPAEVFPDGLKIVAQTRTVEAGTVISQRVLDAAGGHVPVAAGRFVRAGITLTVPARFEPVTRLAPSLLASGFSHYDLTSGQGILVADGTRLAVTMPVHRLTPGKGAPELETWLPPLAYLDEGGHQIVHRSGASLSLTAQGGIGGVTAEADLRDADVRIGEGARVSLDPGQSLSMAGASVVIQGTVVARGGDVSLIGTGSGKRTTAGLPLSLELGEQARIDVSGVALTAVDARGSRRGKVLDGGRVRLGGDLDEATGQHTGNSSPFVVVREGAHIDISGAQAQLEVAGRGPVQVASHAGSLSMVSASGISFDGDLTAHAGGDTALGGRLAMVLQQPSYFPGVDQELLSIRELGLSEKRTADGAPAYRYGTAHVSVDAVREAGVGRLSLYSDGLIRLDGSIDLDLAHSLQVFTPVMGWAESASDSDRVRLAAPHVRLGGVATLPAPEGVIQLFPVVGGSNAVTSLRPAQGSLIVSADLIDLINLLQFGVSVTPGAYTTGRTTGNRVIDVRGFSDTVMESRGDIRFLKATGTNTRTELRTQGNLTLRGRQVYPTTEATALVTAGYRQSTAWHAEGLLRIESMVSGDLPSSPHSLFGRLSLEAARIEQAGVLRAPGGSLSLGNTSPTRTDGSKGSDVLLLPGSVTSVSTAGMHTPYGGTVDGLKWQHGGKDIEGLDEAGVALQGRVVQVEDGAQIDLSGGGEIAGAGFVSGRGGSVDLRLHPLLAANPSFGFSQSENAVYAIVPGHQGPAPLMVESGAGAPLVGQTLTLAEGVPGLPAGTYTLLPSTFALQPGAFRVELPGQVSDTSAGPSAIPGGSWSVSAQLGFDAGRVVESLARQAIVTPADVLRQHSQYNTRSHTTFAREAASRAAVAPWRVMDDAAALNVTLAGAAGQDATVTEGLNLVFAGDLVASRGEGGFGATVSVKGQLDTSMEIVAAGEERSEGFTGLSLDAGQLNAMAADAERLVIGGSFSRGLAQDGARDLLQFIGTGDLVLREGAVLRASEVILGASQRQNGQYPNRIAIEDGASIDTLGQGEVGLDARAGYVLQTHGAAVVVSNGIHDLIEGGSIGATHGAPIRIGGQGSGSTAATLYGEGTLGFSTSRELLIDDSVRMAAGHLTLATQTVNLGTEAALADAARNQRLPDGFGFGQATLERLLRGDAAIGAPAIQSFTLSARNGLNFFGDVSLSTLDEEGRSMLETLVLRTPSLYGSGTAGGRVSIETGHLVWTGFEGQAPATVGDMQGDGPGWGQGALVLAADVIELGHAVKGRASGIEQDDRLILGFAEVTLQARERLLAGGDSRLRVHARKQDSLNVDGSPLYEGGDLRIETPRIGGQGGASLDLVAGGEMVLTALGEVATLPDEAVRQKDGMGVSYRLQARDIRLATTLALPSGRLELRAERNIDLTEAAQIDLAGRSIPMRDVTQYGWGGDLLLDSRDGHIRQAAGSVIDVSARNNHAGSITLSALGDRGLVDLQGQLLGHTDGEYDAGGTQVPYRLGSLDLRARQLGTGDLTDAFAALNSRLDAGEVFGARTFRLAEGDLVIGDLKASEIGVSLDDGHLTVTGHLDASGAEVGRIRLAAAEGLTLSATSLLDAHGERLRVDGHGQIIDSPNRAMIELHAGEGRLTLASGARMDVRHGTGSTGGDGVARGTVEMNAPRLGGATSGELDIEARGELDIDGARSIIVNAVQRYDDARFGTEHRADGDRYQIIDQDYLNARHDDSTDFMTAALGNAVLLEQQLSGLNNDRYRDSFQLRPGVEIVSADPDGHLLVQGDLDLSGHRYDGVNPNVVRSGEQGSGTAGALVIRAGGDLDIHGSINDGFAPPPTTPDDNGWILRAGPNPYGLDLVVPQAGVVLQAGTTFRAGRVLNYDLPVAGFTLAGGSRLPVAATLGQALTLPAGSVLSGDVTDAAGQLHRAGSVLSEPLVLAANSVLGAGFILPENAALKAMTWPAGVPLPEARSGVTTAALRLSQNLTLSLGALIPGDADVKLPGGASQISLRPARADGRQGANWAVASMLPSGSQSWSMRLVAGADLSAADRRSLRSGAFSGNMTLSDQHLQMARYETRVTIWVEDWGFASDGATVGDPIAADDLWWCDSIPEVCGESVVSGQAYSGAAPSVVRTGSGDLELLAAGDLRTESLYGIYTAGTPQALDAEQQHRFDRPRASGQHSVLGTDPALADLERLVNGGADSTYHAWYPELGGHLLLHTGGDLVGTMLTSPATGSGDLAHHRALSSARVSNWLWRQGVQGLSDVEDIATAWWINFGSYVRAEDLISPYMGFGVPAADAAGVRAQPYLLGFTGFGTLGGGDLSIRVGGHAGIVTPGKSSARGRARSEGIVAVVGATGRVGADGGLRLTGGGDMDLRIGGRLNPRHADMIMSSSTNANDLTGLLVNLRGHSMLSAQAIGGIAHQYSEDQSGSAWNHGSAFESVVVQPTGGLVLMPGDAVMRLDTRGDLVWAGAGDPGRSPQQNAQPYRYRGIDYRKSESWFSLWTPSTAMGLTSIGGDLVLGTQVLEHEDGYSRLTPDFNHSPDGSRILLPSRLSVVAPQGSLFMGGVLGGQSGLYANAVNNGIWLAPGERGFLELLVGESIYGGQLTLAQTSAHESTLATPWRSAFHGYNAAGGELVRNMDPSMQSFGNRGLIAFGSPTAAMARDPLAAPTRIYALAGDIVNLRLGEVIDQLAPAGDVRVGTWYMAAAPLHMHAGRNIIDAGGEDGSIGDSWSGRFRVRNNLVLHHAQTDVSRISAGGSILTSRFDVAGPGLMELAAGRDIIMNDVVQLVSHGAVLPGDTRAGASIALMAGMAPGTADWEAVRQRYLDPDRAADPDRPLADQPGRAVKTYDRELLEWLTQRFDLQWEGADPSIQTLLAYFDALPAEQQQVFLRQVYYAELREGGREYNDQDGPRYGSYLRGREMIATLFPDRDADGNDIQRRGDIVMFGGSGVRTDFGGDIEMMAPGGQVIIGVEGQVPPASAGLVTQGEGDIRLFSEGSLLLGLSRIMTTFGGSILAWSAEGDINAGRGAKTTMVFTPPRRIYDPWGNVALAPQVPSSGAGIATLNPIPEVPPGDIDLIAPLGTIDAGEAGIRVSGNVNVAALQVVNADNIQVQGTSKGLPVMASINVGALSSASAASNAAGQAAEAATRRSRTPRPSLISVQVLGFGEESMQGSVQGAGSGPGASSSAARFLGAGELDQDSRARLTEEEMKKL